MKPRQMAFDPPVVVRHRAGISRRRRHGRRASARRLGRRRLGLSGHGQGRPYQQGHGAHIASVVAAALRAAGQTLLAATDLAPTRLLAEQNELEVITDSALLERYPPEAVRLVSGIGSIWPTDASSPRARSIEKFTGLGYQFTGLRHPFTWIAPTAVLAQSCQIHAGAIVQPGAMVGDFSIINTRASIDHDCCIEDLCHIGPGVTLSGNVKVGSGSHLGTGCTVVQGVRLGKQCFVAAGATVVRDVAPGQFVRGTPAVPFERTPNHASR